jgi:tRNA (cytidine/uridine-2'-O-)-methyltransferase
MRIVLVAPRIPTNVGNISRTAAALGAELHLVGPLGFRLQDRSLKRSSVGYWLDQKPEVYVDAADFWKTFPRTSETQFVFATKYGSQDYAQVSYASDCVLIFGNEEEGVPKSFWNFDGLPSIVACRIRTQTVRCLNLSVSVAVFGFEVSRQWGWGEERMDSENLSLAMSEAIPAEGIR